MRRICNKLQSLFLCDWKLRLFSISISFGTNSGTSYFQQTADVSGSHTIIIANNLKLSIKDFQCFRCKSSSSRLRLFIYDRIIGFGHKMKISLTFPPNIVNVGLEKNDCWLDLSLLIDSWIISFQSSITRVV